MDNWLHLGLGLVPKGTLEQVRDDVGKRTFEEDIIRVGGMLLGEAKDGFIREGGCLLQRVCKWHMCVKVEIQRHVVALLHALDELVHGGDKTIDAFRRVAHTITAPERVGRCVVGSVDLLFKGSTTSIAPEPA